MLLEPQSFDGPAADAAVSSDYRPTGLAHNRKPHLVIAAARNLRQSLAAWEDDVDADLRERASDLDVMKKRSAASA